MSLRRECWAYVMLLFFIVAVRTVTATALTAITPFKVILGCKAAIAIGRHVIITLFQFYTFFKMLHFFWKVVPNITHFGHEEPGSERYLYEVLVKWASPISFILTGPELANCTIFIETSVLFAIKQFMEYLECHA